MSRCLLYYITDRASFPGNERVRRGKVLEKIGEAARAGVDYIQLREKDLSTRDLESLAREAVGIVREAAKQSPGAQTTALLINSRTDVALAVGADGVHLRSDDISPQEVRKIWKSAVVVPTHRKPPFDYGQARLRVGHPLQGTPVIGVSCHSPADVAQAHANGATFAVFAPVFEKQDAPGLTPAGIVQLAEACREEIPVLALGGVALGNARSCLEAGAAGVAGIRLFQDNDVAEVVKALGDGDRCGV